MFYIYFIYNANNDVIYVGKTINLHNRISQHKNSSQFKDEISYIEYSICNSEADMAIYEIYYINKLKPEYNISSVYDTMSIELPDLEKIKFDEASKPKTSKKTVKLKKNRFDEKYLDIGLVESEYLDLFKNNKEFLKSIDIINDETIFTFYVNSGNEFYKSLPCKFYGIDYLNGGFSFISYIHFDKNIFKFVFYNEDHLIFKIADKDNELKLFVLKSLKLKLNRLFEALNITV